MKTHNSVGLMASGLLLSLSVFSLAAATDQRGNLPTVLEATSAHPSLSDQAEVVGRLVGMWDVEYTDFGKDGKVNRRTGRFIVGWVLDGRALQDVWIVDPSGTRKDREVYTDVHYFDSKSRTWHSAFVDPEHGSVARFTGGPVGSDRYVLETQDMGKNITRWSFNDIRADSFVHRDESSSDGGKTWKLQAEYHMKRRSAG